MLLNIVSVLDPSQDIMDLTMDFKIQPLQQLWTVGQL